VRLVATPYPAALLVAATLVSLSSASGGYFPAAWGWSTLALSLACAALLVLVDRLELGRLDVAVLGAFAGLVAWTGLSVLWSQSQARSVLETQRSLSYLTAVVTLLLLVRRASWFAPLVGVLVGVAAIAVYGLATRLFPATFGYDPSLPYQLSRPVGYWNALGLLSAMGMLLALGFATHARRRWLRAVAASLLPLLAATLFFTFSRGSWAAFAVGLVALMATDSRRARTATVLLAVVPATALALWLSARSSGLTQAGASLDDASRDGRLLSAALLALAVAAAATVLAAESIDVRISTGTRVRRAAGRAAMLVAVTVAATLVVWGGGPRALFGRASEAFTGPPALGDGDLNDRLFSATGNSRADYWSVALRTAGDAPVLGNGAGTFELRWYRDRPGHVTARDAHSLYLETLAELGPGGLLLLCAALGLPLVALRFAREPLAAGGAAAYVAYLVHAGVDWDWELPAVTIAALACAAALLAAARGDEAERPLSGGARAAALATSLLAAVAGVGGYVGAAALAESRAAFDAGAFERARREADNAVRLAPWSEDALLALGEARLALGERDEARAAFRDAAAKEPNDWYAWYELALASDGSERASALDRASRLNPLSPEVAGLRG
jgi:hypothetical protein